MARFGKKTKYSEVIKEARRKGEIDAATAKALTKKIGDKKVGELGASASVIARQIDGDDPYPATGALVRTLREGGFIKEPEDVALAHELDDALKREQREG